LPAAGRAVETDFHPRPAAGGHLGQQVGQSPQLARPDHQVHVRSTLRDMRLVLLGHAAEHADDFLRVLLFERFQPAQGAVDLVFGVLTHATGVQQDRVRLAGAIGPLITRPEKLGGD